jgi:hypothetical protein
MRGRHWVDGSVRAAVAAGAGGRLVMRLLAVTAGPDTEGRVTEAEQVVGRITVDGTLGVVVFTALLFGLASGFVDLLLHRRLGRWPGLRRPAPGARRHAN